MPNSIKLFTDLGWIFAKSEVDIKVPKITERVLISSSGTYNQRISTGGNLLGYPLGFEKTNSGRIYLLYITELGIKSSVSFRGNVGFQCATNVLNSFCTKAFRQIGISARAVCRDDFNKLYEMCLDGQLVEPRIKGSYWLASTSARIDEEEFVFCLDSIEDGVLKSEPLMLANEQPLEAKKGILALVRLRVDIEQTMKVIA